MEIDLEEIQEKGLPIAKFEVNPAKTHAIIAGAAMEEVDSGSFTEYGPATWTLGFVANVDCHSRAHINYIVHFSSKCSNMTKPMPVMIHHCVFPKIQWCKNCRHLPGVLHQVRTTTPLSPTDRSDDMDSTKAQVGQDSHDYHAGEGFSSSSTA